MNVLEYSQANAIYESTRQHLREIGEHKLADQKYFVVPPRLASFQESEPSFAKMIIIPHTSKEHSTLTAKDDPDTFNELKFKDMLAKSMQVLDTDFDNYLVLYTCQEDVEFFARDDTPLQNDQVFTAFINSFRDRS